MNNPQRKSVSKFLYDVAKIVIAVAVVGNVFSKEALNATSLLTGVTATISFIALAYFMERRVQHDE